MMEPSNRIKNINISFTIKAPTNMPDRVVRIRRKDEEWAEL